ncbi:MAG TPA: penicillin acylase family protein [Jatrophihabitantaceae bacterium]
MRWLAVPVLALALLTPAAAWAAPTHHDGGARIVRDEYGVPHVYASTERALFFGNGYAQAQDRLWQADLVRRTATGTLAELLGPGADNANVDGDTYWRTYTGGQTHLHQLVAGLDRHSRTAVDAFVAGINAWIAEATRTGALPLEYAGTHSPPRPWTAEDVAAVGMLSIVQIGTNGSDELTNAATLADLTTRLGAAQAVKAFADTHWRDDPSAPTTIPGRAHHAGPVAATRPTIAIDPTALRLQRAAQQSLQRLGLDEVGHSNAIALSGRLTRSGHPLLLGGPQIGYSVPQGFVEIGLHGAGYDATGVALAGTPAVTIGVGRSFAWTVTSGGDDNQDWYAEQTDPGHPGQYFYKGAWRPFACRPETIVVAGAAPVSITSCASVHGPVLGQQGPTALALADATRDRIGDTIRGFLAIDRASSLGQFLDAGRQIGGSINLTYADSRHIAYAHVGPVPIRARGDDPFLPHPGDGSDDWRGFIARDRMPLVVDPSTGWLANWNNKPQPGWTNSSDGFWQWGPVQRVQAIQRQLVKLRPHEATMATLEHINRVTGETAETPPGVAHSVLVPALLKPMLDALGGSDPVRQLLRGWDQSRVDADGDGHYDSPALTIFTAWYADFVDRVIVPILGSGYSATGADSDVTANLVSRLLSGRHAALPLAVHYLHGASLRDALTASLDAATTQLTSRYGSPDPKTWLTADVSINWSPQGAGTVPATPWMNRGIYNQIVSFGRHGGIQAENVVAPGQSGDPRSPHFADQLQLYATWTYKPMRLDRSDLAGHTTSDVTISPAV